MEIRLDYKPFFCFLLRKICLFCSFFIFVSAPLLSGCFSTGKLQTLPFCWRPLSLRLFGIQSVAGRSLAFRADLSRIPTPKYHFLLSGTLHCRESFPSPPFRLWGIPARKSGRRILLRAGRNLPRLASNRADWKRLNQTSRLRTQTSRIL